MVRAIDFTHDPAARSWLASANAPGTDFPIQNLPFGVFRRAGTQEPWRGGVALGDQVVDLAALAAGGRLDEGGRDLRGVTRSARYPEPLRGIPQIQPVRRKRR